MVLEKGVVSQGIFHVVDGLLKSMSVVGCALAARACGPCDAQSIDHLDFGDQPFKLLMFPGSFGCQVMTSDSFRKARHGPNGPSAAIEGALTVGGYEGCRRKK